MQDEEKENKKQRRKNNSTNTLKAITVLSLLANHIENRIDQLGSFGVVTLSPVVPGTGLAENEVIGPEDLAVGTRSDAVHGPRLEIHENSSGHEPTTTGFVVVDIDPLELEIRVPLVLPGGVDAVLGADDLPELGSDLVTALASLDVKNLSHFRYPKSKNPKRQRDLERERGLRERERERERE
ncbi:hypothetical protein PanWU01x14_322940, partial [Parasponia andersonii]